MRSYVKLATLALVATFLAGCMTPSATNENLPAESGVGETPSKIVIAIQPTDNADAIKTQSKELESFLEERTGADIEIIVPLTYVGTVEALRFGHAQAAFVGSWPAVMAHKKAGADIVLAENRDVIVDGEPVVAPYYYSYYVVPTDSPYQTLEDLRGKTVAYASPTSTSGYIFPAAELVKLGLISQPEAGKSADPEEFFGKAFFAGGYAQAWAALQNGQADVAVTAGDINAKLFNEVMENTRIVHTQGPVPSHAVVFASDFQGPEREALKSALLELKGDKKELMRQFVSGIFVEFAESTTEAHVAALSEALELTGIAFQDKL